MPDTELDPERAQDPEQPIAWRGVLQETAVRSSEGEAVGHIVDLLGSDEEDIFHGIVVHLGRLGHVTLMTPSHIDVAYTADQIHALPQHTEERQFELGWVGFFRKHLGWKRERDR